jgi:amino acid transporter
MRDFAMRGRSAASGSIRAIPISSPVRTASVNPGGTPGVATVVTTGVAVLLIASGSFQTLIALASVFLAVNYCVSCLALVVLRRRGARCRPAVSRVGIS